MGSDGGWICGGCNGSGRGSDGGHGRRWGFDEGNDHGRDRTDAYYQNMIEANPSDALLLGNYAKFLKEVIICFLVMFYFFIDCEKQKMILNYLPYRSDHSPLKDYQAG